MKVMLLAAGEGTRLRPLTNILPKCMIPIEGKPILEHNIEWLRKFGLTDLVVNLHHLPHIIQNYFGDGSRWGVHITYSIETSILGTAGGVKRVADFFDETFLVWYADNLSNCDVSRLGEFHRAKDGLATIALFHREDVAQSGIVDLNKKERIIRFLEKPKVDQIFSHWVSAGIYILEPSVLEYIPSDGVADFGRDVFPSLLMSGQPLYGYRMAANEHLWWIDTVEDLHRTERGFLTRRNLA